MTTAQRLQALEAMKPARDQGCKCGVTGAHFRPGMVEVHFTVPEGGCVVHNQSNAVVEVKKP